MSMFKNRKGFTLVELLVVVVILAILAGIVVGVVPSATARAKKSGFAETLSTLQSAVDRFYVESNAYPAATQPVAGTPQLIDMNATDGNGAKFLGAYLRFAPNAKAIDQGLDPANGTTVYYYVNSQGRVFAIQGGATAPDLTTYTGNVYTQDNVGTGVPFADVK